MSNYDVFPKKPKIEVYCPKHGNILIELRNGLIGEDLWWCDECEKVYELKPVALRAGKVDRAEVNRQLKEMGIK